jgi:hypothetical protein
VTGEQAPRARQADTSLQPQAPSPRTHAALPFAHDRSLPTHLSRGMGDVLGSNAGESSGTSVLGSASTDRRLHRPSPSPPRESSSSSAGACSTSRPIRYVCARLPVVVVIRHRHRPWWILWRTLTDPVGVFFCGRAGPQLSPSSSMAGGAQGIASIADADDGFMVPPPLPRADSAKYMLRSKPSAMAVQVSTFVNSKEFADLNRVSALEQQVAALQVCACSRLRAHSLHSTTMPPCSILLCLCVCVCVCVCLCLSISVSVSVSVRPSWHIGTCWC